MKSKKTTISEIAKALGITASTVSRSLNDHPRISIETKKKVFDMAQKLGYEPNTLASSLRKGYSPIVGIIVPFADRVFFSSAIRGIEEEVKKYGFNVIICQSYEKLENEIDDINALLNVQVAGIIISPSKETATFSHLRKVMDQKKPLIIFDRITNELNTSSVGIDDYQGAYQAVVHLYENHYRKIAFFSGYQHLKIFAERFRGYKAALSDFGLAFDSNWIVNLPSDVEAGKKGIEKLMSHASPPDALLSTSDHSALGALKWLKSNQYSIPNDIGIIGFSNEPFTQYIEPRLSTVDQKSQQMGTIAAKVFMEEINLSKNIQSPKKILLTPELLIRESSARLSLGNKVAI